jgi:hypothetical protein
MSAKVYEAYEVDETDAPEKLGRIAIDGGVLSIVSLDDESGRESVQDSLDDLNNRPFLVEKAPPKDGERYDIGATEYERGEPGFDDVLIKKLESSHGIRLEAAQ